MIARPVVVVAAALLVAAQVVRNASVGALAERQPDVGTWPSHPQVELNSAMVRIAQASRDRRAVPAPVFAAVSDAARKAPLDPRPFLVRGVQAQVAGDLAYAEQAFSAAQKRDPRSLPAAYFLADHYFRAGDAGRGLNQVVTLARLAPNGIQSIAPYVAAYAQDRSNWPRLRAIFRAQPELADTTLLALAGSARNADTALALADRPQSTSVKPWLAKLLETLVVAGEYQKAKTIWAQLSGFAAPPNALVTDPSFSARDAPPPFGWQLTSSTVGLAERQAGGRLHVIFYGQEEGALARQLLVLSPGTYRLSSRVSGERAGAQALSWTLRCDKAAGELGRTKLAAAAGGWTFQVPPSCRAQWLELVGAASDIPQQAEVTISDFTLTRGGAGA